MALKIKKLYSLTCLFAIGCILAITTASCSNAIVSDYQAKAITTLTWQVYYSIDPHEDKQGRYEQFSSNSLTNINGQKPAAAFGNSDNEGLWWPAIPSKPSLDEIEARAKLHEKFSRPELSRNVRYRVIFTKDGERLNLKTNYSVYRQVVKASRENKQLRFILGINDGSVEKAEAIDNQ